MKTLVLGCIWDVPVLHSLLIHVLFIWDPGTPETAANFCRRSGFPAGNLYCDPDRSLYLDVKLNQGWMSTLFSWGSLQVGTVDKFDKIRQDKTEFLLNIMLVLMFTMTCAALQASWALQFPGLSIFKDSMKDYDRSMTMPANFDLALQQVSQLLCIRCCMPLLHAIASYSAFAAAVPLLTFSLTLSIV